MFLLIVRLFISSLTGLIHSCINLYLINIKLYRTLPPHLFFFFLNLASGTALGIGVTILLASPR